MKSLFIVAVVALLAGLPLSGAESTGSDGSGEKTEAAAVEKTAATLTLEVEGLRNRKGNVLISLYDAAKGFPGEHEKALRTAIYAAKDFAEARFENLAPGIYAVSVCHDENGSLKLETGLFGRPKEGVGVSGNVKTMFLAPKFEDACFKLAGDDKTVSVKLHY